MKFKALFFVLAIQLYIFTPLHLYCEQKLINVTEDTLAQDSYRPIAGKEFLVAVKLVDVDTETNTEQPLSNETIFLQTNAGALTETEVVTNTYGEAITWLKTSDVADTTHTITATVKDKAEITPVIVEVKNIALQQGWPSAEEIIQQVEENANKIKDIMADIQVSSNAPWEGPSRQLKIWQKGDKQKIQEISPEPGVFIRPILPKPETPPTVTKEIVGYNAVSHVYVVQSKENDQVDIYPIYYDYIDGQKAIITKKKSYIKQDNVVNAFETIDLDFMQIDNCWVFQEEQQIVYQGVGKIMYNTKYQYSNLQVNTGISESEFTQ